MQLGGKVSVKKIDKALEKVYWDFELSDLSVIDMFSKLHSIMSSLVNYVCSFQSRKAHK